MKLRGFAIAVLAIASTAIVGQSASAADPPTPVTFSSSTSPQTTTYGDYWSFVACVDGYGGFNEYATSVTGEISGPINGPYTNPLYFVNNSSCGSNISTFTVSQPFDSPPVKVGSYDVSVTIKSTVFATTYIGTTVAPGKLTVEPAAIGGELRLLADPNSPQNAIITVRMTGDYISNLSPNQTSPSTPRAPTGSWAVTVKDPSGATVLQQELPQVGQSSSAVYYWTGIPEGTVFSASATFTPIGDSVSNFTYSAISPTTFTSSSSLRPEPTPSADAAKPADTVTTSGITAPVWALALIGLALLGLGAGLATVVVRARRPAASAPEPAPHEVAAEGAVASGQAELAPSATAIPELASPTDGNHK